MIVMLCPVLKPINRAQIQTNQKKKIQSAGTIKNKIRFINYVMQVEQYKITIVERVVLGSQFIGS